ncbi:MAG: hypothetical protein WBA99_14630, partial [Nodosilinea sp.]
VCRVNRKGGYGPGAIAFLEGVSADVTTAITKTLTITFADALEQALAQSAAQAHQSTLASVTSKGAFEYINFDYSDEKRSKGLDRQR